MSLVLGALAICVTCLVLATLPSSVAVIIMCGAVSGVGVSLAYSAMPVLVMSAVPITDTAVANGVNALVRMVGTSFCSAFVGAVLAAFTVRGGTPTGMAFTVSFLVSAGAAAIGAGLAVALIRTRGRAAAAIPLSGG